MNAKKLSRRKAHGAATPAPVPSEPETKPLVLPSPKVQPAEADPEPEPEAPQPATSHLLDELEDFYLPFNYEERVFVAKLADCRGNVLRREIICKRIEVALYRAQNDPAKWQPEDFGRLALADSYRRRAEEDEERAQKNVDAFMRQREDTSRWVTTHDLAERRYELQKRQYELDFRCAALREQRAAAATSSQ